MAAMMAASVMVGSSAGVGPEEAETSPMVCLLADCSSACLAVFATATIASRLVSFDLVTSSSRVE